MLDTEGLGVRVQGIPREQDEPLAHLRMEGFQRPVEAGPVQFWHAHVTQDQIIGVLLELHERQSAVGRGVYGMAVAAQQLGQCVGNAGFIIHKQNGAGDGGQRVLLRGDGWGCLQGDRILSCSGEHRQQVVFVETT